MGNAVCPTTLKRICRQHGITRWPSRKIKKVGHSLKKLQLVIDSVQGAEGAIQIGSFYAAFPELSTSAACTNNSDQSSTKKMHIHHPHHHHHHIPIPDNNGFYVDGLVTNSPACSQTQTSAFAINHQVPSSTVINNGGAVSVSGGDHVLMTEGGTDAFLIRRAHSEADLLHASINLQDQDTKTKHFNTQTDHGHDHHQSSTTLPPPPPPPCGGWNINNNSNTSPSVLERGAFRVKATFADEKIRFSLQPVWGFRELQQEIARRFNLSDMSSSNNNNNNMVVKYVDDEGEWVVLGCDADLEECKDLHRSSHTRTIRLSLFQASPLHTFRNSSSPS